MLKTIKKYNRDPYALDNQLLHFHNTSDLNILIIQKENQQCVGIMVWYKKLVLSCLQFNFHSKGSFTPRNKGINNCWSQDVERD